MATYDDYMDRAFAGMKGDSGNDRVETFAASGDIPFGVVVTSAAGSLSASAGGSGDIRGISLHSHAVKGDAYAEGDAVSTMTRGLCWAKVDGSQAVTQDGAVYFAAADGTVSDLITGIALPNAVFRSGKVTVAGGDIALVELDHPFA